MHLRFCGSVYQCRTLLPLPRPLDGTNRKTESAALVGCTCTAVYRLHRARLLSYLAASNNDERSNDGELRSSFRAVDAHAVCPGERYFDYVYSCTRTAVLLSAAPARLSAVVIIHLVEPVYTAAVDIS